MFDYDEDDALSTLPKLPAPTPHDIERAIVAADEMETDHIDIEAEKTQLRERAEMRLDRARKVMDSLAGTRPSEAKVKEAFEKAGVFDGAEEDAMRLRTLEFIQMARQRRN